MAKKKPAKLWEGRFTQKTDPLVDQFTESLSEDHCLYHHDIAGSVAHTNALARLGLLTPAEQKKIVSGLSAIEKEIAASGLHSQSTDEDIHMYIERRLTEKIGPVGGKLHTGRSRNDQVALDVKLYLREKMQQIVNQMALLQKAIVGQAEQQIGVYLPGYTHLQRAQPVLLSHHLLAYYEMIERDKTRLGDGLKRLDQMPLGAGAMAGNSFSIDRAAVALELGFSEITANSIDTVSDRDFIVEFLSAASILMMHLSRWAEELILWNSSEFKFVALPDRFCTGSSIMPQKKNPDILELIRGKTGRVYGNLMGMLTVLKGLPLSYNRDMQEDKRFLFDTVKTVEGVIGMMTPLIAAMQFNAAKMEAAASDPMLLATDLADYLVLKGVPFRETHKIIGQMVQASEKSGKPLNEWLLSEFQKYSQLFEKDLFFILTPKASIEKKSGTGGTATVSVKAMIKKIKKLL
jgi:argininosuccinate lyase